QIIFQASVALYDRGQPVDLVTLAEQLKEQKHIEDIGGYSYLAELLDAAPTAANAEYYARIVRDKAIARHLLHAGIEIARDASDQALPAEELLQAAERKIFAIAQTGMSGEVVPGRKAVGEAYLRIDARQQRGNNSSGVLTGFIDLDKELVALMNSE